MEGPSNDFGGVKASVSYVARKTLMLGGRDRGVLWRKAKKRLERKELRGKRGRTSDTRRNLV